MPIFSLKKYVQTYTVPSNVHKLIISAMGAKGGTGREISDGPILPSPGGQGAYVAASFDVTPGDTFGIFVGARGGDGVGSGGGGGGGASWVWNNNMTPYPTDGNSIIVAGGGGGGNGYISSPDPGSGGYGLSANGTGVAAGNAGTNIYDAGSGGVTGGGGTGGDILIAATYTGGNGGDSSNVNGIDGSGGPGTPGSGGTGSSTGTGGDGGGGGTYNSGNTTPSYSLATPGGGGGFPFGGGGGAASDQLTGGMGGSANGSTNLAKGQSATGEAYVEQGDNNAGGGGGGGGAGGGGGGSGVGGGGGGYNGGVANGGIFDTMNPQSSGGGFSFISSNLSSTELARIDGNMLFGLNSEDGFVNITAIAYPPILLSESSSKLMSSVLRGNWNSNGTSYSNVFTSCDNNTICGSITVSYDKGTGPISIILTDSLGSTYCTYTINDTCNSRSITFNAISAINVFKDIPGDISQGTYCLSFVNSCDEDC